MTDSWRPLPPLIGDVKELAFAEFHRRLQAAGIADIRPAHGCVFRFIDEQGARLTDLAERSNFTKQAVGEAVIDLERLGYVERVADPGDGRAKIIRLTTRGREAQELGRRIFLEIEQEWAAAIGRERMAILREGLEALAEMLHHPVDERAMAGSTG